MNALRLTPVFLSALLFAAHFSRAGNLLMTVVSLAAPAILLIRRPWIARTAQVALMLGALEWVRTLIAIAARRQEMGEPWLRMAVILGIVALVTAVSATVFQTRALRARYSLD
jgi:hypothetical protein